MVSAGIMTICSGGSPTTSAGTTAPGWVTVVKSQHGSIWVTRDFGSEAPGPHKQNSHCWWDTRQGFGLVKHKEHKDSCCKASCEDGVAVEVWVTHPVTFFSPFSHFSGKKEHAHHTTAQGYPQLLKKKTILFIYFHIISFSEQRDPLKEIKEQLNFYCPCLNLPFQTALSERTS